MPQAALPIITLTSDFGLDDFYVGTMKGAVLCYCPHCSMIDITHAVPRHDVLFGAIVLERAIDAFPDGVVHLAVVDPGVGTDRRMLVARWDRRTVVCPDNGLITWAWRRRGPAELWELTWRPQEASHVFHGRDIMGPAAAMLAGGTAINALARRCEAPVLLESAPATNLRDGGRIIHIDHFGNATSNIPDGPARRARSVTVAGRDIGPVRQTYADVAAGEALALIGSSGLLEIAVREGSAAEVLGVKVGDSIETGEA
jgi:S-adenosylmethionine hydrolase